MQVCLPAIWALSFLLVTYRLGVLPAESAASLKLLDKGVAKEALAALVLVQFPVELVSAVVAGRCVCACVCACWRLLGVSADTSLCLFPGLQHISRETVPQVISIGQRGLIASTACKCWTRSC